MIEFFRKMFGLGLYSSYLLERYEFVRSDKFKARHMSIALNDEEWVVRHEAVISKHFSPEHMEIALNDEHWCVRLAAVISKYFSPEHMEIALYDKDWRIAEAAIWSEHFEAKHLAVVLKSDYYFRIRWTVEETKAYREYIKPESVGLKEGTTLEVISAICDTRDCTWLYGPSDSFIITTETHLVMLRKNLSNYEIRLYNHKFKEAARITTKHEHPAVRNLYAHIERKLKS